MYRQLGELVSRMPVQMIVMWTIIVVWAFQLAPDGVSVWTDGEFAFLPQTASSRRAEELFRQAFPILSMSEDDAEQIPGSSALQQDPLGSSIVLVLERLDSPQGLGTQDWDFVRNELLPRLNLLQERAPLGFADLDLHPQFEDWAVAEVVPVSKRVIEGIVSPLDRQVGPLLVSEDRKAALIVIELTTEFLDRRNGLVVARLERLLESPEFLSKKPIGLVLALSGSATVGRDMLRAETDSASRTELYTKVLVIVLLLLLYRAPLLALVPLVTVGVAVELTKYLLRLMAQAGWIGLFNGLEVYVTVVVYGAGVDYCLFLMARYKEELDRGLSYKESIEHTIWRVGAALATSAGTSIVGIAMMIFAEFGKFRQAGVAISFGLFVVLCFAVTFTPAFLLLLGRWAFWPDVRRERPGSGEGWIPETTFWKTLEEQDLVGRLWRWIVDLLDRRPGLILLITVLLMLPFAGIGAINHQNLSYGPLSDLPQNEPSVLGARVVQNHFAAGVTGPATVLIRFPKEALLNYEPPPDPGEVEVEDDEQATRVDLRDLAKSRKVSAEIVAAFEADAARLRIVDIRSQVDPFGTSSLAREYLDRILSEDAEGKPLNPLQKVGRRRVAQGRAHRTYSAQEGEHAGQVLRIDLVFQDDPLASDAIQKLTLAEEALHRAIPAELQSGAEILSFGPTAGIRDLKRSTDRDQIKIDALVAISVYLVLVLLLRRPAICAFLIVSVAFSYLVSLGVTFLVFYYSDPQGFYGLDWKVPIYLFTILIAMGEDYNILLMSRVAEEQHSHGTIQGILRGLLKTGSIISSCGIIMAGTFASLMSGSLLGMRQLGFALAFGVLLDTFVVRPLIVPAYLLLLYRGWFGTLGPWLGANQSPAALEFEDSPAQPAVVSSENVEDSAAGQQQ